MGIGAGKKNAVVLSSGGLDSTTIIAMTRNQGFEIYSLSFSYGQLHSCELNAASKIADCFNVKKHVIIDIDLNIFGGSALTDNIKVPKHDFVSELKDEIPVTYVPARNTIFLSYALAYAEVIKAYDIFIGVNAVDYSGYPDCRPEYIAAYEKMANLATKEGVEGNKVRIQTPLINMTKSEIISSGIKLGVDYSMTHSCYDPSPEDLACGRCDSCLLRKKGFEQAGVKDPTRYYS